jgi:hypothetical protein
MSLSLSCPLLSCLVCPLSILLVVPRSSSRASVVPFLSVYLCRALCRAFIQLSHTLPVLLQSGCAHAVTWPAVWQFDFWWCALSPPFSLCVDCSPNNSLQTIHNGTVCGLFASNLIPICTGLPLTFFACVAVCHRFRCLCSGAAAALVVCPDRQRQRRWRCSPTSRALPAY